MPVITLRDGDFGFGEAVRFDSWGIFLPDPARRGATVAIPFTDVEEIEALADDHSGRLKEAGARAMDGLRKFGPAGLAMGVFGVTKVKDVMFGVQLNDGRGFTAVADAATFADLHSAQIAARALDRDPALGAHPADEVIARYLGAAKSEPPAAAPSPLPPAAVQPATPPSRLAPPTTLPRERPVFGRRGR